MTPQELRDLTASRPFAAIRLDQAGELEVLINNLKLPRDLRLIVFFDCPFEAFAKNPTPSIRILRPQPAAE